MCDSCGDSVIRTAGIIFVVVVVTLLSGYHSSMVSTLGAEQIVILSIVPEMFSIDGTESFLIFLLVIMV